jgi:hypothetical protein
VALGKGKAYISLNKKIVKQANLESDDAVTVSLAPDQSKYGMEMSKELKELLNQDLEGKKRFDGLVGGKQRYIIYYVKKVKSPQLRIERAVMLIENLKKLPKGKETFKGTCLGCQVERFKSSLSLSNDRSSIKNQIYYSGNF